MTRRVAARYLAAVSPPRVKTASGYGPCPVCSEPGVMRCRCRLSDTKCPNGHVWHFMGDETHLGSGHDTGGDHSGCEVVTSEG